MNIHEYQAKEILARHGVPVNAGEVADTPEEARAIAERIGKMVVVKAQVLVGGRGKAGGVKLAKTPDEAYEKAKAILGMDIKGITVQRVLTDNGAGSRYTSADYMIYLNRHKIDWKSGRIEKQETVFLHDPDRKVPFRIVHEDTAQRYLTGADVDTESFQIVGDQFWIGEEFGPYLIKADKSGKVIEVFETVADGMTAHPTLSEAIKEAGLVALGRAIHLPNKKKAAV